VLDRALGRLKLSESGNAEQALPLRPIDAGSCLQFSLHGIPMHQPGTPAPASTRPTSAPDSGEHAHEGHEWRWLWRQILPYIHYEIGSLVLVLLANAVSLTSPLLMKWLIDSILPQHAWRELILVTALFFSVSIGGNALRSTGSLIAAAGVMRCAYQLRRKLLRHLVSLPASFYAKHPVGDLVQRAESDVSLVAELGSDLLPQVVNMVVQTTMTIGIMIALDWRLTIIALPLAPVFEFLRHRYRTILRKNSEDVREASGTQSNLLNELLTGMTQIQLLGAERRMARGYARLNLRSQRARWRQRKNELMFSFTAMTVVALGSALILGYGGARVMNGQLTAGSLVAFYSYIGGIFAPLSMATELYARLNRVRASVRRLLDIENAPNDIRDRPDATPLTERPRLIVCTGVTFRYERVNGTGTGTGASANVSAKESGNGTAAANVSATAASANADAKANAANAANASQNETEAARKAEVNADAEADTDLPALDRADFDAHAGERVAIVGTSGCGKSSLLKLLPRLYDVDDGRIEIDGRDVRSLQLRTLREAICFVPQEPILFQGTLRENLRHGCPTASAEDLERAIRIACLTDVVSRLPDGLKTKLGPMGAGLSGGEKQRVAIARAILQDRPIVILDEATSALDARTERRLLARLKSWCRERIVIVVSHRLAASKWADRVVVFDAGRVIEDGSHNVLFQPGSFYFDLWDGSGNSLSIDPEATARE
jgi:ATP-binding cassette, subfamily B, bacterial